MKWMGVCGITPRQGVEREPHSPVLQGRGGRGLLLPAAGRCRKVSPALIPPDERKKTIMVSIVPSPTLLSDLKIPIPLPCGIICHGCTASLRRSHTLVANVHLINLQDLLYYHVQIASKRKELRRHDIRVLS